MVCQATRDILQEPHSRIFVLPRKGSMRKWHALQLQLEYAGRYAAIPAPRQNANHGGFDSLWNVHHCWEDSLPLKPLTAKHCSDLSWTTHVQQVCSMASHALGKMRGPALASSNHPGNTSIECETSSTESRVYRVGFDSFIGPWTNICESLQIPALHTANAVSCQQQVHHDAT